MIDHRGYFDRMPLVRSTRGWIAGCLILLSALTGVTSSHAQPVQPALPPSSAVPTLEALPHHPLPPGDLWSWCGWSDKVLMETDRWIRIYDGDVKSPSPYPSGAQLVCGEDGKTLNFVEEAGSIYEVDLASGTVKRTLATFEKQEIGYPIFAFAPDLKTVVTNRPLVLRPGIVDLKIVSVSEPHAGHFGWSRDASQFFTVTAAQVATQSDTVEIFNAQHQKIGSGRLPSGSIYRDGWFASSQALYLYLNWVRDEFGVGVVLRCRIEGWKCDTIARNVLEASAGGDGILGIVSAIGKYSDDGETITFPPRYGVEIRDGGSRILARQTFKFGQRESFGLAVSPSGSKAVLTWFAASGPGCIPEKIGHCKDGMVIDLPGRIK